MKREIIQSLIYKILPKVNQVVYTLDTIYDLNIMSLAQAVLEIYYSKKVLHHLIFTTFLSNVLYKLKKNVF